MGDGRGRTNGRVLKAFTQVHRLRGSTVLRPSKLPPESGEAAHDAGLVVDLPPGQPADLLVEEASDVRHVRCCQAADEGRPARNK